MTSWKPPWLFPLQNVWRFRRPGHIFQPHHLLMFHATCSLKLGPALVMRRGLVLRNGFIVPRLGRPSSRWCLGRLFFRKKTVEDQTMMGHFRGENDGRLIQLILMIFVLFFFWKHHGFGMRSKPRTRAKTERQGYSCQAAHRPRRRRTCDTVDTSKAARLTLRMDLDIVMGVGQNTQN